MDDKKWLRKQIQLISQQNTQVFPFFFKEKEAICSHHFSQWFRLSIDEEWIGFQFEGSNSQRTHSEFAKRKTLTGELKLCSILRRMELFVLFYCCWQTWVNPLKPLIRITWAAVWESPSTLISLEMISKVLFQPVVYSDRFVYNFIPFSFKNFLAWLTSFRNLFSHSLFHSYV